MRDILTIKPLTPHQLFITNGALNLLKWYLGECKIRNLRFQLHNGHEDDETTPTLSLYNDQAEFLDLSSEFSWLNRMRITKPQVTLGYIGLTSRRMPNEDDQYIIAKRDEARISGWLYDAEHEGLRNFIGCY